MIFTLYKYKKRAYIYLGEKRHSGRICAFFCGPSFSAAEELEEKKEREEREEGQEWKVWEVWEVITVTSYPGKYCY